MFKILVRLGNWLITKFNLNSLICGVVLASSLFIVGIATVFAYLYPTERPVWIVLPMLGNLAFMIVTIFLIGKIDSYIVTEPSKSDYGFIGMLFVIMTVITAGLEIPLLAISIPVCSGVCSGLCKLGNVYVWIKRKFEETEL